MYLLFIILCLSIEFYYIEFMGGALRGYHFLAPFYLAALANHIPKLFNSALFWVLSGFILVNALTSFASANNDDSLRSFGLLVANASIAYIVSLIILSGRVSLKSIVDTILLVAIVGITVGVLQLILFTVTGINTGLSDSQRIQVAAGFSSGLKSEANTFAKFLNVAFLLTLPRLLAEGNNTKSLIILAFFTLGMLTSLTRSAIYGLIVTLVFIYLWYLFTGRGRLVSARVIKIFGVFAVGLVIYSTYVIGFNEYAAYKLTYFFDTEEIFYGGSSGLRLMSQSYLWEAFMTNETTFWIGNGWGQVLFDLNGNDMQAGGAEIALALAYGGVISAIFYLMYMVTAMTGVNKTINSAANNRYYEVREGVLFALLGLFITGQVNGAIIAPEYWLVFGMAMAIIAMGKPHLVLRSTDLTRLQTR